MTALEKNIMKPRRRPHDKRANDPFEEKVIEVSRVSRTVKGGRRIRFRALVVVGDRKGRVGMGLGKSNEVSGAVQKASSRARKSLINVPIIEGTIPHEILGHHGAAKVLLKPASSGTSIVAGGSVRVVADLAGVSDLLAKSLGSRSKINNVAATINAFSSFSERVVTGVKEIAQKKTTQAELAEKQIPDDSSQVDTEKEEAKPKKTEKKPSEKQENKESKKKV